MQSNFLYLKSNDFLVKINFDAKYIQQVSIVDPANINHNDLVISLDNFEDFDANYLPKFVLNTAKQILKHLSGDVQTFNLDYIDTNNWTKFKLNVFKALINTSASQVVTYKELAKLACNKNAFRAVGSLMSRNKYALLLPCHRVIKINGELGNYSGFGNILTKAKLLAIEGLNRQ